MSRLELSMQWVKPPEGEAFGPESPTWARFEMRVGEISITKHSDVNGGEGVADEAIEGPLCGLAEWAVDNFRHVLWEANVPAPSLDSAAGFRSGVPGLREANSWWSGMPHCSDLPRVAAWQSRHTFGAATSQLAIPSMVFVPEATRVGLFVESLPRDMDPSIWLQLGPESAEFWLERADLRELLSKLVDQAIERAAAEPSGVRWAAWLAGRWATAKEKEASESERRRLRFGELVASEWDKLSANSGTALPIIEGVLSDVDEISTKGGLAQLLNALSSPSEQKSEGDRWRKLLAKNHLGWAKPYEEGYELARRVRRDLQLGVDPIDRVDILLSNLNIEDRNVDSGGAFRSAGIVHGQQAAVLVDKVMSGVTARRVALATAFGRLLFDSKGKTWGGAFGDHARVLESRRAGAFAAELLAPGEIVPKYANEPQRLAEDYGISRKAAEWRIHNVLRLAQ